MSIVKRQNAILFEDDVPYQFNGNLNNLNQKRKQTFKAMLASRQAFACHYCRCHMTLDLPTNGVRTPDNTATFEHLIDVFAGGGKKGDNCNDVVLACAKCNAARGVKRVNQARRYYIKFFAKRDTLGKLVNHPKIGWKKIIETFGPMP